MSIGRRTLFLAISLVLPALLLASTQVFVSTLMKVGDNDRAMVWAHGSAENISKARASVISSTVFSSGKAISASEKLSAPKDCGSNSVELSFGKLHLEAAQSAREELEAIAETSGLVVCASNIFQINDISGDVPREAWPVLQRVLLQLFVPAGLCLCLYWAFRDQLTLPPISVGERSIRNFGWGLIAAVALLTISNVLDFMLGLDRSFARITGNAAIWWVLALLVLSPTIEEIAFRAWMITLSERMLGGLGAGALSTLTSVLTQSLSTPHELLMSIFLGATCSALYLRTRSLVAAISAHAGYMLLSLGPGTALS